MMELLSADVEGMSREEEMYSRRGALKLLLMNQARMIEANKVVTTLPPPLLSSGLGSYGGSCFLRLPPIRLDG